MLLAPLFVVSILSAAWPWTVRSSQPSLMRTFAHGQRDDLFLAAAIDMQLHILPRLGGRDQITDQVLETAHVDIINAHDDISLFDAGTPRRCPCDLRNEDPQQAFGQLPLARQWWA